MIAPFTVKTYGYDGTHLALNAALYETDEKKSKYQVETAMKLKGSEKDVVHLYSLDSNYMEQHVQPNRLLKLLYVALSRARNTIYLYFNTTGHPTHLLNSLEGSFLKYRYVNPKKLKTGMEGSVPDMKLRVGASGSDKSKQGGLCQSKICCRIDSQGFLHSSVEIPTKMDVVSSLVLTKAVVWQSLGIVLPVSAKVSVCPSSEPILYESDGLLGIETSKQLYSSYKQVGSGIDRAFWYCKIKMSRDLSVLWNCCDSLMLSRGKMRHLEECVEKFGKALKCLALQILRPESTEDLEDLAEEQMAWDVSSQQEFMDFFDEGSNDSTSTDNSSDRSLFSNVSNPGRDKFHNVMEEGGKVLE